MAIVSGTNLGQQKQAANFVVEYKKCINDYNAFVNFLKVFWEANYRLAPDLILFQALLKRKSFFDRYMQMNKLGDECRYYINDLKGCKFLDLCVSGDGFIYEFDSFYMVILRRCSPFYICSHNSSFGCIVPFDIIPTMDWFMGQYSDERFVAMVHKLNAAHFLDTVNKFEQYFNTGFDQFFKQVKS